MIISFFLILFFKIFLFSGSASLLSHLRSKHKIEIETIAKSSDPERFKCDFCGKIFAKKIRLEDHVNVHKGLKPHICGFCGQGFACRANKCAHVNSAHKGIKRGKSKLNR